MQSLTTLRHLHKGRYRVFLEKEVMTQDIISTAVQYLRAGKLVAIPTETVYGLAADASQEKAVRKIFEAKGRPLGHPLIVHIANTEALNQWAIDIPKEVIRLTQAFWPGPLTVVLKRAPHVLDILTGGQDSIALRAPRHPLTQALLLAFQGGLAAPSANRFGHLSPTHPDHVREELGSRVDFILDGGRCELGIESTILDFSTGIPKLLRPGMLSVQMLEAELKQPIILPNDELNLPRVSGSLAQHYAPHTPAFLMESHRLESWIRDHLHSHRLGILARQPPPPDLSSLPSLTWVTLENTPEPYAREMYDALRRLDAMRLDLLGIEAAPQSDDWRGIADRLHRATAKQHTLEGV